MQGFPRLNGYPARANRPGVVIALLGLTFLGISISVPRSSAQAQQTITKPLEHEVGVALKLIHVYVTDKKGKPVPDLVKDEFELYDNGTPVTVTEFERHALGIKPDEPPSGEEPKTFPEAQIAKQAARKFLLFFDLAYNDAYGIAKAKEAAARFIDMQAQPDDEIGAVSYSTFGGLKVHEFLTRDHAKVRAVLDKIDQGGITGRAEEIEDIYWRLVAEYDPQAAGDAGGKVSLAVADAKAERQQIKNMTQTFVNGLTVLAKALRSLPGQKNVVLFSRGVPTSLIYGNQAGSRALDMSAPLLGQRAQFDMGDTKLKTLIEQMFKEFAAAGCAFYALDTHMSAKGADPFALENRGGSGVGLSDSTNMFVDSRVTGADFLRRFSDVTGGRYFTNINAFEKNLDQIQTLTGAYYVLGYSVNERWDGRFHDIKVKVKRKGCEVRAQAGYFNPKPYSEYTKLEKELHLYDLALNERAFSRMPFSVPMIPLVCGGGAGQRLGIVAGIPGEVTAKLSGSRIECVVIFFDDKGEVSKVVRAETDPSPYRGQPLVFTAGTELGPGSYTCRLVARDMDTGSSAVGSAVATIGTARATGLQLSTPLILTEGAAIAHVDAGPAGRKDALPLAETYAYDRSRLSPVVGEVPPGAASVQAIVPYWAPGEVEPDIAFQAYAIDAKTAARTAIDFSRVDRIRSGPQGLLSFEIPLAGLAPGTYYLHFHGEDRASNSAGHTSTSLIIPRR
jgi:VWFA-related protein